MKSPISGDLFDICGRLREIDPCYYVMFDGRRGRFEVHHSNQRGDTLCVVVPHNRLDARALVHVRRTRAERREALIAETERANKSLEAVKMQEIVDRAKEKSSFGN